MENQCWSLCRASRTRWAINSWYSWRRTNNLLTTFNQEGEIVHKGGCVRNKEKFSELRFGATSWIQTTLMSRLSFLSHYLRENAISPLVPWFGRHLAIFSSLLEMARKWVPGEFLSVHLLCSRMQVCALPFPNSLPRLMEKRNLRSKAEILLKRSSRLRCDHIFRFCINWKKKTR